MRQVQVADEGAHQPGLADAGSQREAERREVALEIRHGRELIRMAASAAAMSAPSSADDLGDAVKDLQDPLRRTQAETRHGV